jgi:hypothetical protein
MLEIAIPGFEPLSLEYERLPGLTRSEEYGKHPAIAGLS